MARFTVRVELHDSVNGKVQEELHRAMKERGFSRVINVGKGKQYCLPAGEFRMAGRRTRAQVRTLARQSAASTGKPCSILVTEGACSWYNLEEED